MLVICGFNLSNFKASKHMFNSKLTESERKPRNSASINRGKLFCESGAV